MDTDDDCLAVGAGLNGAVLVREMTDWGNFTSDERPMKVTVRLGYAYSTSFGK